MKVVLEANAYARVNEMAGDRERRHFFFVSALARLYMHALNQAIRRLLAGLIVSLANGR